MGYLWQALFVLAVFVSGCDDKNSRSLPLDCQQVLEKSVNTDGHQQNDYAFQIEMSFQDVLSAYGKISSCPNVGAIIKADGVMGELVFHPESNTLTLKEFQKNLIPIEYSNHGIRGYLYLEFSNGRVTNVYWKRSGWDL